MSAARRHLAWRLIAAGVVQAVVAGGCARGQVELVELNFRRLPAAEDLVGREAADACYWWVEGDQIRVALGRYRVGVPNELHRERFDLSLALPGLPAEQARNYTLDGNSLRCYVRRGAVHHRYRSRQGIAAVWLEPGRRLRGRFRILAQKEGFHILSGWNAIGPTAMVGAFEARYDATRGEAIWQRSEADGMNRAAAANTTPDGRPGPVRVHGPPVKRSSEPANGNADGENPRRRSSEQP